MHEEAQGVDQPAQYKMVGAQQVKGHLWPKRDVLNSSRYLLYCTLKHKIDLFNISISIEKNILIVIPEQRKKEVSSEGGVTVRGRLR